MKRLLFFLLLPIISFGQGDQTIINVPIDNGGGTEKAILHLPDDYSKTSGKYPLLVFLHGIGESGTNPAVIYTNSNSGGPSYFIAQGKFPSSFVNPADKQTYKYIVLSPQNSTGWSTSAAQLDVILTYMLSTYRVDAARLYLTGLSAGGQGVTQYCGNLAPGNVYVPTTHKIAAFMPMSPVIDGNQDPQYATNLIASNVRTWGFGSPSQDLYGGFVINLVNDINALKPGFAVGTSYSGGHCCWGQFYDPNFRQSGMSMYEWALQYTAGTASTPPSSPPTTVNGPYAVPGKVEAENYSAMSGVATETTADAGGGLDVGWIDQGDYMDYSLNVATAAQYSVGIRVATPNAGASFQLTTTAGTVLATVNVPNTGGYQTWQTVTATVTLPAGVQTLRVKSTASPIWNINWMQFTQIVVSTPPAAAIPGTVQAESYSAMSGIGTETTGDTGGGQDVGWIDNGDYMDYAVNVATAGVYTTSFRIATPNTGASFQVLSSSGAVLTTVSVPNTGGYQTWKTITANVTLPAGTQTLRIKSTASPIWNINWIQFALQTSSGSGSSPVTIQAESYSAMSGIGTETTADAGGGQDVGWIDNGDWMDYAVNITTAGLYTANFRIATPNVGASFQVLTSSGVVLSTVTVPYTGGYQVWQNVSATLNLPAGSQTLRIKSIASSIWNINWWQIAANGTVPATVSIPGTVQAESYSAMSGVGTETTGDTGGGQDVGWIDNGDYMDYAVNVTAAGVYTASFRTSAPSAGAALQVLTSGGTVLTTVNVPNTSNFQTWQTVTANVTLPAGNQTLRIRSAALAHWNINWIQFAQATTTTAATVGTQNGRALQMGADSTAEDIASSLILFPNPVHDQLTIRMNNDLTGTMLVQLTDAFGAIRGAYNFSKTAGFSQVSLSTSNLTSGIYFVRIQIGNRSETRKIIKL